MLILTADVSLRYLRKSPNWILGILDGGRGALGTKYMPHVRVKRSYSRFVGSFSAAARFWAGEDMVQFGPSDFSPTSFTLGIRGRAGRCEAAGARLERRESYFPASSSSWVRNTSSTESTCFPLPLFTPAITTKLFTARLSVNTDGHYLESSTERRMVSFMLNFTDTPSYPTCNTS